MKQSEMLRFIWISDRKSITNDFQIKIFKQLVKLIDKNYLKKIETE